MRGYDTIFVQRVKALIAVHETLIVRKFLRACMAHPTSVEALATWFGVSRSTVYNWMTGQTVPRSRHLAEMARATELIVSGTLTGTPKRK